MAIKKEEVCVILSKEDTFNWYDWKPIGVIDTADKESIKAVIVPYLLNSGIGDEEEDWVNEVIDTLFEKQSYEDTESDFAFEIRATTYYKLE